MSNNEVHYYENFLSHDFCDWLINYHKVYHPIGGKTFSNRKIANLVTLADKTYVDEPLSSSDYLKFVLSEHTRVIKTHDPRAFINYSHLVDWEAPIHQPIHQDFWWHTWTSILYLNDDFEGGCTYVDGESIKPKKGAMIMFQGRYVQHGVEPVISGHRYTIATWYKTLNSDY
ncbi:hypothetical protein P29A0810_039 [Synechococcus phage S-CAM8]|jgi:hypothetical protein|uniref:procollagen-proline 3-dioxygenase n=1 Tax=Synechococcus phage S-CAM8 TaxID=754038 RepID=G8EXU0_9CAUD|nr:DNA endonuclease [Synechococcus phage S-CAM8]AET72630.1 hypothetical protein SXFG_00080 [Synechococcus phage S-CAM8]AGN33883.1 hypothetical protein SXCG_00041 [Synechococcus phage S-CAM8]AOV59975.1 hypothetical protein P29A0810_039 [Synechococcus phage S-CAM8]